MRTIAFAVCCFIWLMAGPARAQDARNVISKRRVTLPEDPIDHVHFENRSLLEVLYESDLPWLKNMNIGFIFDGSKDQREKRRFDLELSNASVAKVLDAVTSADGNYYWKQDGTVIDFIPKRSATDSVDVTAKLTQKIKKFEVKDVPIVDASVALIEQAKAQGVRDLVDRKRAGTAALSPYGGQQPGWIPDEQIEFSFSLRDKSLMECLNTIVSADPPSGWVAMAVGRKVFLGINKSHSYGYHYRELTPQELDDLKKGRASTKSQKSRDQQPDKK